MVGLDQGFVNLGAEGAGQAGPAVFGAGEGEEDLLGGKVAAVVVGVEHPQGDLRGVAGFELAGFGVEVVEAFDLHLPLGGGGGVGAVCTVGAFATAAAIAAAAVGALGELAQVHIGLAD